MQCNWNLERRISEVCGFCMCDVTSFPRKWYSWHVDLSLVQSLKFLSKITEQHSEGVEYRNKLAKSWNSRLNLRCTTSQLWMWKMWKKIKFLKCSDNPVISSPRLNQTFRDIFLWKCKNNIWNFTGVWFLSSFFYHHTETGKIKSKKENMKKPFCK